VDIKNIAAMKEDTLVKIKSEVAIAHLSIKPGTNTGELTYEFIEVNPAFQLISGLNVTITGKTLAEVLPQISGSSFDWMDIFNNVALKGSRQKIEYFSPLVKKWFTLHVSSPAEGFITSFITEGKKTGQQQNALTLADKEPNEENDERYIILHKQLEEYREQILKRKKMLRAYFDSNPTATYVWIFRGDDFYLDEINQTVLKQSNNQVKSYIGVASSEIYFDMPIIREKMLECIKAGNLIEFELNYKNRYTGKYEWVYFTIVKLEKDKILLFEDNITKQKKAERDLIRAKERADENMGRYRALYVNAPLSFQSLDENACIIDVNPMWLSVMGYDRIDVIGSWFGSFLHPDWIDFFKNNFPQYKKLGYMSGVEFKLRKSNGHFIDVLYEGRIGYTSNGEFMQTYCVFTDITHQKNAEQALKQREHLLNRTQHLSKVGGWEWDIENQSMTWTKETYLIHDVEPGIFISGNPDHILKTTPFFNPRDKSRILKAFSECVCNGTPFQFEVPFLSMTNKRKWVRIKAVPVYKNEKVVKIVGNLQDITELKRAERERREKERLERKIALTEESLRFKQNFLANMSHEMRTPLTGILGMSEILNRTVLDDKQKDYLSTIIQSGENLRQIINHVLDFSKIEAGKITLKKNPVSLQLILNNMRSFFNSICRKPITFESNLDEKLPHIILADETRIRQVLINLIYNAVKFTEKGEVKLNFELKSRNPEKKQLEIKVWVSDTGKGIKPGIQEKLFIPFSQIEDNDTRDFEGTGLGLSISKELVKMHGGNIGVISSEGNGSTFWFTFIADETTPVEEEKHTTPLLPPENLHKLRILLAEDKVINQKVLKLILTSMGHTITIAQNGKEAVENFNPDDFDLVLMDIQMPVMDGIQATQKLRELNKVLPPIVGLSANAFEGDREKYMAQGLDEYLIKPLKTE
jgi:PAS domain S-box-containing protein